MIFQDIGMKKLNKIFSSDRLTHRNRERHKYPLNLVAHITQA